MSKTGFAAAASQHAIVILFPCCFFKCQKHNTFAVIEILFEYLVIFMANQLDARLAAGGVPCSANAFFAGEVENCQRAANGSNF